MKPAQFDYVRAGSVEQATALLAQHGARARILAGGQSLMAMLNIRLAEPALLIDISGLGGLRDIRIDGDWVEIGAGVTQAELLAWPALATELPLLALALPFAYLHFRSGQIAGHVFAGVLAGISFSLLNNVFSFIGNLQNWQPLLTSAAPALIYSAVSLAAFWWMVLRR